MDGSGQNQNIVSCGSLQSIAVPHLGFDQRKELEDLQIPNNNKKVKIIVLNHWFEKKQLPSRVLKKYMHGVARFKL